MTNTFEENVGRGDGEIASPPAFGGLLAMTVLVLLSLLFTPSHPLTPPLRV